MTQYNIDFAERLMETSRLARGSGTYNFETAQVVCYLTQLSLEVSLKAFLEQAGLPVRSIKKHSHSLESLLNTVGQCEVMLEVTPGSQKYLRATRLRSIQVQGQETVGALIAKLAKDGSRYPEEIRYGIGFHSLPADALIELAAEVNHFVKLHWKSVRLTQEQKKQDAQPEIGKVSPETAPSTPPKEPPTESEARK